MSHPGDEPTVHQAFRQVAHAGPGRPFLCVLPEVAARYGIAAGEMTYGRALAAVDGLAARFAAAGYGHGHRAGLLLENRPSFFLNWLALNALGVSPRDLVAILQALKSSGALRATLEIQ
jgi:acyl-CoA synthetase (AMP-forming)/AMP-acid ligase II